MLIGILSQPGGIQKTPYLSCLENLTSAAPATNTTLTGKGNKVSFCMFVKAGIGKNFNGIKYDSESAHLETNFTLLGNNLETTWKPFGDH